MSISCMMVHWFERLAKKGDLGMGGRYLELGPQGLTAPRPLVEAVSKRLLGKDQGVVVTERIFVESGGARSRYHKDFYSIFGLETYESLDAFDPIAEYRYDLNRPVPMWRPFDAVGNYGTAEHVFRAGKVFEFCHRMTRPGGVMLHVMPAFGDINHGFFNMHPLLYTKLAEQNGYDILDFQYVDDIALRTDQAAAEPDLSFDFDTLPIKITSETEEQEFRDMVSGRFVQNAQDRIHWPLEWRTTPVFDYCFVAMRRMNAKKFVVPTHYGSAPPLPGFNFSSFARALARCVLGRR